MPSVDTKGQIAYTTSSRATKDGKHTKCDDFGVLDQKKRQLNCDPISENNSVLTRNAAYSQNEFTANRVVSVMPVRLPKFPTTIPAATTAMIDETWSGSASR